MADKNNIRFIDFRVQLEVDAQFASVPENIERLRAAVVDTLFDKIVRASSPPLHHVIDVFATPLDAPQNFMVLHGSFETGFTLHGPIPTREQALEMYADDLSYVLPIQR